jgi:hypothetical protein
MAAQVEPTRYQRIGRAYGQIRSRERTVERLGEWVGTGESVMAAGSGLSASGVAGAVDSGIDGAVGACGVGTEEEALDIVCERTAHH